MPTKFILYEKIILMAVSMGLTDNWMSFQEVFDESEKLMNNRIVRIVFNEVYAFIKSNTDARYFCCKNPP